MPPSQRSAPLGWPPAELLEEREPVLARHLGKQDDCVKVVLKPNGDAAATAAVPGVSG